VGRVGEVKGREKKKKKKGEMKLTEHWNNFRKKGTANRKKAVACGEKREKEDQKWLQTRGDSGSAKKKTIQGRWESGIGTRLRDLRKGGEGEGKDWKEKTPVWSRSPSERKGEIKGGREKGKTQNKRRGGIRTGLARRPKKKKQKY